MRYRTGPFARFDRTWYARRDVRTAAETVERAHAASPGARIVVDTLPALSYYLDAEHATYLDRCCGYYRGFSRERGSREVWSGRRLLGTSAELIAYADPADELWLLREADPERHTIDLAALADAGLTEVAREIVGQDGRIEFIRLRPPEAAGAPRQAITDATD